MYLVVVAIRRWDVLLAGAGDPGGRGRGGLVRRVAAGHAPGSWPSGSRSRRWCCFAVGDGREPQRARARRRACSWPRSRPPRPRVALRPPAVDAGAGAPRRRGPATPVLIMNPWSGGGKVEKFELERLCRERGIEPIVLYKGSRPARAGRGCRRRGADVIGMAGGDGSQALVASVASRHGIPFVVIPAGTRNHFALDLGMDRERRRRRPRRLRRRRRPADRPRRGQRPGLRQQRVDGPVRQDRAVATEYRDAKMRTAADDAARPDRARRRCRSTCGSPCRRGSRPRRPTSCSCRTTPTSSRTCGAPPRGRGWTPAGSASCRCWCAAPRMPRSSPRWRPPARSSRFSGWNEWTATEFEVTSGGPVEVGVDGEALTMDPPLRFVIRPGALTVRQARAVLRAPGGRTGRARRVRPPRWAPCGTPPWAGRWCGVSDPAVPGPSRSVAEPVEPAEERLARRLERARRPTGHPVAAAHLGPAAPAGALRPGGLRGRGAAVDAGARRPAEPAVALRQPLQAVVPHGRRARGVRRPHRPAGRVDGGRWPSGRPRSS